MPKLLGASKIMKGIKKAIKARLNRDPVIWRSFSSPWILTLPMLTLSRKGKNQTKMRGGRRYRSQFHVMRRTRAGLILGDTSSVVTSVRAFPPDLVERGFMAVKILQII